jgi:hypothetical protein
MTLINCRLFRLSTYREHKVMGLPPVRRFGFVQYRSGDHGGRQWNGSLTVGLTTFHLKLRITSTRGP